MNIELIFLLINQHLEILGKWELGKRVMPIMEPRREPTQMRDTGGILWESSLLMIVLKDWEIREGLTPAR